MQCMLRTVAVVEGTLAEVANTPLLAEYPYKEQPVSEAAPYFM